MQLSELHAKRSTFKHLQRATKCSFIIGLTLKINLFLVNDRLPASSPTRLDRQVAARGKSNT